LGGVAETWWDAGGIFACPETDSPSARCQNREEHSPLAIHTSEFLHVLVVLAAGLAFCYGESINLTWRGHKGKFAVPTILTSNQPYAYWTWVRIQIGSHLELFKPSASFVSGVSWDATRVCFGFDLVFFKKIFQVRRFGRDIDF
jgi:hypothetical protein